jgi:hypothetical protein
VKTCFLDTVAVLSAEQRERLRGLKLDRPVAISATTTADLATAGGLSMGRAALLLTAAKLAQKEGTA